MRTSLLPLLLLLPSAATAFVVTPTPAGTFRPVAAAYSYSSSSALASAAESPPSGPSSDLLSSVKRLAAAALLSLAVLTDGGGIAGDVHRAPDALAVESRIVGEIAGSGIVMKDILTVESFDDPKVKGVTLYVSSFQRPLTERLQKDFFSDPGQASVGCAKTGPVQIADNIALGKGGEEVFKESKSLLFKSLRVQRIYDEEKKTVVYVSFNTRLDKNDDTNKSRFKSSTCAVNLE
mmetsp:Transcript_2444/g.5254  ORF Transcript_2444/g.5254 Transcript_2444/m.5254 type:complete len:235 (-) Transcript_2444:218-922(-)